MGKAFYRRRMGVCEHIESGEISLFDDGLHDFVCMKAQHRVCIGSAIPPGVWVGSARAIWLLTRRQDEERKIRRSLEKLEGLGWIKRWHRQGETGDYPILINRLVVRDEKGNDFSINAADTNDWRHPVLVPLDEPRREVSVRCPRGVRGVTSYYIDSRLVDSNTLSPTGALQDIWKKHHGILPEIQELSDGREKKLGTRLRKDPHFLDKLKTALQKVNASSFIRDGTWKPGLSWFLGSDDNILKVLEGNYDSRGGKHAAPNSSGSNSGTSKRTGPFVPAALRKPIPATPNALTKPREC
jgi:hypothetical protein